MIHELLAVLNSKDVRSNLRMASILALVLSLLALIPSLAVSLVLDRVIKLGLRQELIWVLVLLLLFHVLEVVIDYWVAKISDHEIERVASALESVFLRAVHLADYRRVEGFSRSELQAKFAGLAGIAGSFVEWRVWMIVAPASSVLIFLALGYFSKELASIIFLLSAIYVAMHLLLKLKIKSSSRETKKSREFRYRKLFELFENLPNASAMGVLAYFMERLREGSTQLREKVQKSNHLLMWQSAFGDAYQRLVLAAILGVGAYQAMEGEISIGQLVMANMLSRHLASNIRKMSALLQKRRNFSVEMEGVKEISEMLGGTVSRRRLHFFDSITVADLEFRYPGKSKPAFRGLSFFAKKGQLVVVTGPSGCGKSTLLKILAGLYVPTGGSILLESDNESKKNEMNVAYMLQREMIFDGSIEDNISMGRSDISPVDIKWACEVSGADEFIENLPRKLKFKINENGVNISGGQRQRLGLARTLAGRPDLLLLDEPTAALDKKSKKIIANALRNIAGTCTSVVVTHDREIVDLADIVVEFDHGGFYRIVEKDKDKEREKEDQYSTY